MSQTRQTRRIITGHDNAGKAIFESDMILTPANPLSPSGEPLPPDSIIPGFTGIYRTKTDSSGLASDVQAPFTPTIDPHGKMQNLTDSSGVMCRIVDFPPVPKNIEDNTNIMHRTVSIDYGVVLEGEIELVLDDGVKTVMKTGDVVVQRGTIHHWNNHTNQNCRILFVLVPSVSVVDRSTGEDLAPTDTTHLEKAKS